MKISIVTSLAQTAAVVGAVVNDVDDLGKIEVNQGFSHGICRRSVCHLSNVRRFKLGCKGSSYRAHPFLSFRGS